MRNISLYYLMGLSSCVSTKWGVTTIIMYCCCFVLFSVTHTLLCVATKWGVTTIIIYCLVSIYCVLRYVYSTYVYLVLVRSNVYYGANSDMGVRIL